MIAAKIKDNKIKLTQEIIIIYKKYMHVYQRKFAVL